MQTLSRLNRAYHGPHGLKDTTYVLDFVNEPDEVLAAFRLYHDTATLAGVSDPQLILELKARLDASGHYDAFEVDRVVRVELNPQATQGQLIDAIQPVANRLLTQYKAAQRAHTDATDGSAARQAARDTLDALQLFKRDIGTYARVYAFLGQLFDYGNTEVEKRAIFFRRLLPLLDFGREREGIDLSKVVLTHYRLSDQGMRTLPLGEPGGDYTLSPLSAPGSGTVQDTQKALLSEILAKMNDLFDGELSEADQLSFVTTLGAKLGESKLLVAQAGTNTAAQFAASPDLDAELMNALMDALEAFQSQSMQALNSDATRAGLKDILLGPGRLYERLRAVA